MRILLQILVALLTRLVPAATALLASYGIHVSEGTSMFVTVGLAVAVYLGAHAVSIARDLIAKRRQQPQS